MKIATQLTQLVGNTPLIKLRALSEQTGCTILGKCEFLNPGGSIKDRTALAIIQKAMAEGAISKGGTIVEATAGNTGIGLAILGNSFGLKSIIFIPSNQSKEKMELLKLLGAELHLVPVEPCDSPNHYLKQAERYARALNEKQPGSALLANQFNNLANKEAHRTNTGVEIIKQTGGDVDGFVCAAGTGGTIAGISEALRHNKSDTHIALIDVQGSSLYNYFTTGKLQASDGITVTEGTGIGFITDNMRDVKLDSIFQSTDAEALPLLYDLLINQGLCLGSSTAINLLGAQKLAEKLGPGHTIVTMLCDIGQRYQSTVYNPAFLQPRQLPIPPWMA